MRCRKPEEAILRNHFTAGRLFPIAFLAKFGARRYRYRSRRKDSARSRKFAIVSAKYATFLAQLIFTDGGDFTP